MKNRWSPEHAPTDPLHSIVYLSNIVGLEHDLVQPGGGNTSIKIDRPRQDGGSDRILLVKGSGTDLRTIGNAGFTALTLENLARLRECDDMTDEDMMSFLANCMLDRHQAAPSVETPLHSLLPHIVIVHTHDIATMSLTNLKESVARSLVDEVFEGKIFFVPYVRPGFPLAHSVAAVVDQIPPDATGLALAHHGLVVWGDDPHSCYDRLLKAVSGTDDFITTTARGKKHSPAKAPSIDASTRRAIALEIMPVIRGALSNVDRVILHFDDSDDTRRLIDNPTLRDSSAKGVATPEHILRAGRKPIWLDVVTVDDRVTAVREQIAAARTEYLAYHNRNAPDDTAPVEDWAKVLPVPGLGLVTAFKDKKSATTANACIRASFMSIENADALDQFEFIPEQDVFEFEHWPLERRKVDESIKRERERDLLARQVVVIVGGASGIGRAAAHQFSKAGANVIVADIDETAAKTVADELNVARASSALGVAVDVRESASLDAMVDETVLTFGGIDCLFYTAGAPPRFAPIHRVRHEDLLQQMELHCFGAILAIGRVAEVMMRQGTGGSIIASVSKAAVSPGKDAVAYGASKAALLQALRVAAVELGPHGIRANAINADQIETPLFMRFVEERARMKGVTVEQQLESYRQRNLMGVSLIPPEAVADMAVLMASKRFAFTTGDFVTIDGGLAEAFPR